MKAAAARRAATEKAQAETLASQLAAVSLVFTRKSGDSGHLFGSVTAADIAHELAAKGFDVDRRKIQLVEPLKSTGDVTVPVRLYREVIAQLSVRVLAEAVEAPADAEPVTA